MQYCENKSELWDVNSELQDIHLYRNSDKRSQNFATNAQKKVREKSQLHK